MEKFQELEMQAKKKLQLADHIATMTYPLVQDSKLLMSSIENIFLAYSYGMGSVLHYDLLFKHIPQFPENFNSKFDLFKEKCMRKHDLDPDHLSVMKDLRDIVLAHKKSPVEFTRKENFVMCNDDYRLRTISMKEVKNYLEKAKLFIKSVNSIVNSDTIFANKK
ncbi:hypothetical protein ISS07_03095 [Candidatus Woesearchaeota archaeon]|nr:hypothetical protein [Candidatus Woesearchaeota archaeon]